MKRAISILALIVGLLLLVAAYPTVIQHQRIYPHTSLMSSPYSCDPSGTNNCAAAIEKIKTNQSSKGTIFVPKGTFRIGTNLTIPAGMVVEFAPDGKFAVDNGVTLTIDAYINAAPTQIFSWTGTGTINISNSPVDVAYLEWWGAKTGTSNDCTTAISKCFAATNGQTIQLLKGKYRVTSGITYNSGYRNLRIRGQGKIESNFYIDLGGSGTAFQFGEPGTLTGLSINFEDFSFIGPASCCTTGVKFYLMVPMQQNRVAYFMGASGYAIECYGCEHVNMQEIYVSYVPDGSGPAGGMFLSRDPVVYWDNTVWQLNFHAHGAHSPGGKFSLPALKAQSLAVANVSGVIEGYTVPLDIGGDSNTNANMITFQDLYIEGGGTYAYFTNSGQNSMIGCLFNDSSLSLIFDGCSDWNINNCLLRDTYFKANCRGIKLSSNTTWYSQKIYDEGHAAVSVSETRGTTVAGNDYQNLLYNSSFIRWNDTTPDSFGNGGSPGTYTKCGVGQADTTRHSAPYSVKVTTTSTYAGFGVSLDANQLARVLGRQVTWNIWAYCPTGQTLSGVFEEINIAVPAWQATTAYNVGDGHLDTNNNWWVVVTAGTSGSSIPTFPNPPNYASKVTDGTVIWGFRDDYYIGGRYSVADKGRWKNVGITRFVPRNATALDLNLLTYRDTTDCYVYFSEPSLTVGNVGNSALIQSTGEGLSFSQIGANRISYGTAVPTTHVWCQQGDVIFRTDATASASMGWMCTTSGWGDGSAVWKTMPALGS